MSDWHWWLGSIGAVMVVVIGAVVWAGEKLTKIVTMLTELRVHVKQSETHGATLADHDKRISVHDTRISALEAAKAEQSGGWRRHDAE